MSRDLEYFCCMASFVSFNVLYIHMLVGGLVFCLALLIPFCRSVVTNCIRSRIKKITRDLSKFALL
jgi:Flp pilus assembly protein TadB